MKRGIVGLALLCTSLAGFLLASAPASALTVYTHDFVTSFNGTGSTPGAFSNLDHIGLDQSTHTLYVYDRGYGGVVDKFDASVTPPVPANFSGLGATNLTVGGGGGDPDLAVDNSGTASQGQIYFVSEGQGKAFAFQPSGTALGSPFPVGGFGDPCGIAVDPTGTFWVADYSAGGALKPYHADGTSAGASISPGFSPCHFTINPNPSGGAHPTGGYFYVAPYGGGVSTFDTAGVSQGQLDPEGGTSAVAVNTADDHIYVDHGNRIKEYSPGGALVSTFGGADPGHGFSGMCGSSRGVAVNANNGLTYVADCGNKIDVFAAGASQIIPTTTATAADDVTPTSAVLHGTVDADGGGNTTDCHFEWGTSTSYGNSVGCAEGDVFGDGANPVSASITNLTKGSVYHFRVVSQNSNGIVSNSGDQSFRASGPPLVGNEGVTKINTDGAKVNFDVDPNGGTTTYHLEWGTDTGYGNTVPVPDGQLDSSLIPQSFQQDLAGLAPGTEYHFRVVAHNDAGTTLGDDQHFITFPLNPGSDVCANHHVRQQTGAALLLDCRAYELVSAANAGGYDVESNIVPGQAPLTAYPQAHDRLLYSLHAGMVPGIAGNPTNFGLDPYVATRGADGWSTSYVGIPANGTPSAGPFGSPLLGADAGLSTFAFGYNGDTPICAPCFGDGSTNVPLHLPDGSLVKGMAGSLNPAADPAGEVDKPLSDDGSHFVFGSTSQFELTGNDGSVSIYDRNLSPGGATQVVSTMPNGTTMSGSGIAELDISANGDRIVIGKLVSTDADGNEYWHLYLHVGSSPNTIDLTPGTTSGVLFDGMSADGTKVFFTSADQLTGDDSDNSADLFRADISAGSASLSRVSTGSGGSGDTDSCSPAGTPDSWNAVSGDGQCGVVAIAGGGGVAGGDGTVFFFSPEMLDTSNPDHLPVQDQPNLYVAAPGSAPHFVATVDSSVGNPASQPIDNAAVLHGIKQAATHSYGDFQVTPSGRYAVFSSSQQLTDLPTNGHYQVYRYDTQADQLDCASCSITEAPSTGDVFLTSQGLNLSDDGKVFFTSPEQLVLRDTDEKLDAYEWNGSAPELISTGASESDSGMLSASADGVDAFFFTRQKLVPGDLNGNAMKIYDARADGGFPYDPPRLPCAASDECHGPGTVAAPPPPINTVTGSGPSQGNTGTKHRKHHKKHRHRKHRRHTTHRHG